MYRERAFFPLISLRSLGLLLQTRVMLHDRFFYSYAERFRYIFCDIECCLGPCRAVFRSDLSEDYPSRSRVRK